MIDFEAWLEFNKQNKGHQIKLSTSWRCGFRLEIGTYVDLNGDNLDQLFTEARNAVQSSIDWYKTRLQTAKHKDCPYTLKNLSVAETTLLAINSFYKPHDSK